MSRGKKASARGKCIEQLKNQKYDGFQLRGMNNTPKPCHKKSEKITLWKFLKKIYLVIADKADTHGDMTSGAFAFLVSIVFRAVAIVGFLIFSVGIYSVVLHVSGLSWQNWPEIIRNIYALFMVGMILFILVMCSVIMWGASNEMRREKDKNYIVAVFSGVVSFAALIVALVALVKE